MGGNTTASGTWKLDGKTMTLEETAPAKLTSVATVGLDGGNLVSVMKIDTVYNIQTYGSETIDLTMTFTASK
jgi:hypothetical protein